MKRYLLTIATVVYNNEKFIGETITSILGLKKQYDNIEYIVIDGGSTDATMNIISGFRKDIDCILHEKDKGIYDAMNKAAQKANGEYLLYINSGDLMLDIDLSILIENLNQDVIYGNIVRDNNIVYPYPLRLFNYAMPFCHQAVFVKSDLIREYKFNDSYKIAGDFDVFQRLYSAKRSFKYVNVNVACFQTGGVSTRMNNTYVKEYTGIIKKNKIDRYWFVYLLKFHFILIVDKLKGQK